MSAQNESNKLSEEKYSSILNAPKLKLKKATISPTPFSLNNSENEDSFNTNENSEQSFDEKEYDSFTIPN